MYQDLKEMSVHCDEIIAEFISLNVELASNVHGHTQALFMLQRHGYTLKAITCTKAFKGSSIRLDDCFSMDEILQDLHSELVNNVNDSKEYSTT